MLQFPLVNCQFSLGIYEVNFGSHTKASRFLREGRVCPSMVCPEPIHKQTSGNSTTTKSYHLSVVLAFMPLSTDDIIGASNAYLKLRFRFISFIPINTFSFIINDNLPNFKPCFLCQPAPRESTDDDKRPRHFPSLLFSSL